MNEIEMKGVDEIKGLIKEVRSILKEECKLIRLKGFKEGIFVGDIHGDVEALKYILRKTGFVKRMKNNEELCIIFLGDYIDRALSPENTFIILETLLLLKKTYPNNVFLLRGNHEQPMTWMYEGNIYPYGLINSAQKIYGWRSREIVEWYVGFFAELPHALITPKIFAVHGGIPVGKYTLKDIEKAREGDGLYEELLWNDPIELGVGDRGIGKKFSKNDVLEFLHRNKLERIIRSHVPVKNGLLDVYGDGKLINIFSNNTYYKIGNVGFLEVEL